MKSILSILLLSFFCCSSTFANFSSITGNIKLNCITDDQSKIIISLIKFNAAEEPSAWLRSYKAKLISSPITGGQNYHLFAENITQLSDVELREFHRLEVDGDRLIGIYELGYRKSRLDKGKVKLRANVSCLIAENSLVASDQKLKETSDLKKNGSLLKSILKSIN